MAVSVNTSNTASQVILNVAANAGSLALAADWIQSPMGAGGGAIFGTVHILSKAALSVATDKLLNKNHPAASSATKTVSTAIEYFGSYAAAWGVLAAMGIVLTLSHIINLVLFSLLTSLVIEIALSFFAEASGRTAASRV
jgi:hypothetical protein